MTFMLFVFVFLYFVFVFVLVRYILCICMFAAKVARLTICYTPNNKINIYNSNNNNTWNAFNINLVVSWSRKKKIMVKFNFL